MFRGELACPPMRPKVAGVFRFEAGLPNTARLKMLKKLRPELQPVSFVEREILQRTEILIDLRNDPLEVKNVPRDSSQAARVRELRILLQKLMRETQDRLIWINRVGCWCGWKH